MLFCTECFFTQTCVHIPPKKTHKCMHLYLNTVNFLYLLLMVVSFLLLCIKPFLYFPSQFALSQALCCSLFQHALDLQLAVANILQSLVHTERNQQVMCEAGLHARLLQRCSAALADEDHSLHPPLQRMFERLASQALQPMVLRSEG